MIVHRRFCCCLERALALRNQLNRQRLSTTSINDLVNHHKTIKSSVVTPPSIRSPLNPTEVFTNSELRLSDMDVIGFDYDYTLAPYTRELEHTIFNMIIEGLVSTRHYPSALSELKYDPDWLARGTHYDITSGIFMKVDAYHRIQSESVYQCFRKVPEEEILDRYPGKRLFFSPAGHSSRFRQIVDIFQLPELYAWCAVLNYLQSTKNVPHPVLVYEDISNVTRDLHVHGTLHAHIMRNIGRYLEPNSTLVEMLNMLRNENKKLFNIL